MFSDIALVIAGILILFAGCYRGDNLQPSKTDLESMERQTGTTDVLHHHTDSGNRAGASDAGLDSFEENNLSSKWPCPTDWEGYACSNIATCQSQEGRVSDLYSCMDDLICCETTPKVIKGMNLCPSYSAGVSCENIWNCWDVSGVRMLADYYCNGDNTVCCEHIDGGVLEDEIEAGTDSEIDQPETEQSAAQEDTVSSGTDRDCVRGEIIFKPLTPQIMILQEISEWMHEGGPTHWDEVRSAVAEALSSLDISNRRYLGFDVFPNHKTCVTNEPVVADTGPDNAQRIVDMLSLIEPSAGTPLFMALGNFIQPDYAPLFTNREFPSYLIVVSVGKDRCGNTSYQLPDEIYGANAAQLGFRTRTLRDEHQILTIPIGFGVNADAKQLNAIAQNGGTDYKEHVHAENRDDLETALVEAIRYADTCEFKLVADLIRGSYGSGMDWDTFQLYLNGEPISRNRGCSTGWGWDWFYNVGETLLLCDEQCASLEAHEHVELTAEYECRFDYGMP